MSDRLAPGAPTITVTDTSLTAGTAGFFAHRVSACFKYLTVVETY